MCVCVYCYDTGSAYSSYIDTTHCPHVVDRRDRSHLKKFQIGVAVHEESSKIGLYQCPRVKILKVFPILGAQA